MFFKGRLSTVNTNKNSLTVSQPVGNSNQQQDYLNFQSRGHVRKRSRMHTRQLKNIQQDGRLQSLNSKKKIVQEQIHLYENYLGTHNNFRSDFKNKKYKKIYNDLCKNEPLQKSYFPLFYQDKLFALNKHIKVCLIHKQTNFTQYLVPYFKSGKQLIKKFYKYFVIDDQICKNTKKINLQLVTNNSNCKPSNPNQFFYILITFLHQIALFYRSKSQRKQANLYYEGNLRIIYKMLESSSSSNRIRRKISKSLISFASFLIQEDQLTKSLLILSLCLKNTLNLIGIIQSSLRYIQRKSAHQKPLSQKHQKKATRKLIQSFQFLIAIYLNYSVVFQLQRKDHLVYYALLEVKLLQDIISRFGDIKLKALDLLKKYKDINDTYAEKIHIAATYFHYQHVQKAINQQQNITNSIYTAVYGINNNNKLINTNNKTITQLFFKQYYQQRAIMKSIRKKKKKKSIIFGDQDFLLEITRKIAQLAQKKTNVNNIQQQKDSQQTQQNNQNQNKLNDIQRKCQIQSIRKLSKFCQNIEQNKTEQNQSQTQQDKIRPLQKRVSIFQKLFNQNQSNIQQKSILQENKINIQNSKKKKVSVLQKLIQMQFTNKNDFFYGNNLTDNLNQFSTKSKSNSISNFIQPKNKKTISYVNKLQKSTIFGRQNANQKTNLIKRKRNTQNYQFNTTMSSYSNKKMITCNNSVKQIKIQQNKIRQCKSIHRKLSTFNARPMNYETVLNRFQQTKQKFQKQQVIQKGSIQRLKVLSKKISTKLHQQDQQSLKFSTKKQSFINNLLKRQKSTTKQQIQSKQTNQTGIKLFKKLIFKHKRQLNIYKHDLFINYKETKQQRDQIILVYRDDILIQQYKMTENQTKQRINLSMQELITQNRKNAEQHKKKSVKLHQQLKQYQKTKHLKQFSQRMQKDYCIKHQKKQQSKQSTKTYGSSRPPYSMLLTGGSDINPNLFISSMKFNQQSNSQALLIKNLRSIKDISNNKKERFERIQDKENRNSEDSQLSDHVDQRVKI